MDDSVELVCFTAQAIGTLQPQAEISEVKFINWHTQRELIAPAVLKLCDTVLAQN